MSFINSLAIQGMPEAYLQSARITILESKVAVLEHRIDSLKQRSEEPERHWYKTDRDTPEWKVMKEVTKGPSFYLYPDGYYFISAYGTVAECQAALDAALAAVRGSGPCSS